MLKGNSTKDYISVILYLSLGKPNGIFQTCVFLFSVNVYMYFKIITMSKLLQ